MISADQQTVCLDKTSAGSFPIDIGLGHTNHSKIIHRHEAERKNRQN